MSKIVIVVAVILGIVAAAGAGYWYGGGMKSAPAAAAQGGGAPPAGKGGGPGGASAAAPVAVTVEATKVVSAPMPQSIVAVGSLRSDESITLRPESAGRISEITFKEGQRVAKGTPLVKIDAAIPQAEVAQAKANLTLAKSKFDRAVDLAQRSFISGQAKDEAENNFKVAEASLQLAQAKLAKTDIKAPFTGIIGLRTVSVGDYVKEGADLVNLEAIDPLKVDFRVPETYLRQIQVGQSLEVTLDALPGKTFDGKVIAVNPLIDTAGRSVVIRAQVRNQDTTLRPGMFTRVRVITKDQAEAMVLPERALVPQGTEQFVFKLVDGKATRVRIQTGQRRDSNVEIVSGLAVGDLVVTAGQLKLREGVAVKVTNPEAGKDAAARPSESTAPSAAGAVALPTASADRLPPAGATPVKADAPASRSPKS